ncbi:hypothetical protein P7C70_g9583, partial [Phenoliferia sp. Uapishka_3]
MRSKRSQKCQLDTNSFGIADITLWWDQENIVRLWLRNWRRKYLSRGRRSRKRRRQDRFASQDEDLSLFARIHPSPFPIPTGPRNSESNSKPPCHCQNQRSAPRGPQFAPSQDPSSTQQAPQRHNDFSYPHYPEILPRHLAGYFEPL